MFEKEAKEYADKVYGNRTEMDYYGIAGAFQDGAEFGYSKANEKYIEWLGKAKEIILKLYNAGRDTLMCRSEEKVYDNLSEAINDRSIEQFLKEVSE